MRFDCPARALDAQTASRPERSLRAVTGNRAGDPERHSVFAGCRGDSNRMQVARQLPEQRKQVFEKSAGAAWIEAHKWQSAGQFEVYPRIPMRRARIHRLDNQLLKIQRLRRKWRVIGKLQRASKNP